MTAEDRIHLALLLALGAANLTILGRGPSASPANSPAAALAAARSQPEEATRAELDAAIQRLESWLAGSRSQVAPGGAAALALQGLGPAAEERAHPERWLARSVGTELSSRWLTPAAAAPAAADGPHAEHAETLVVLLEAGVPLAQALSSTAAEKAPAVTLSDLVQRSLGSPTDKRHEPTEGAPAELDLLSLAVLGGMSQYRERLVHMTESSLRRLEREQRTQSAPPGTGDLSAHELDQLARARHVEAGSEPPGAAELHWSAAAFRGTAVLGEADLDAQARRHLNALLSRYHSDRALYLYLEARAANPHERRSLQLQAVESLGRFEEALYNAHLTLRSDSAAGPSPVVAMVMRCAARDLIDHLQDLDAKDFAPDQPGSEPAPGALRAAVRALRGLRTARVAG